MGIYDRNYTQEHRGPEVRFVLPPLTPVVKWLLIINAAVFVPFALIGPVAEFFVEWFSVYPKNLAYALQAWRLVSYQFLHAGFFHIFFNMLILFFFGPMLERMWGSKRFCVFYLVCGAMGGIVYPLLVGFGMLAAGPMVGASGAIYGMMAACAIMFPAMRVYVFGIFPLPLGVLAIIMFFVSFLNLMGGPNAGGEAAHLAGMISGAVYVLYRPVVGRYKAKSSTGNWQKKQQQVKDFQGEVDRILDKVSREGIQSLSRKEKSILKEATRREQKENQRS